MNEKMLTEEFRRRNETNNPNRMSINDLKIDINEIIWRTAPKELTIGEADDLACDILEKVMRVYKWND